MRQNTRMRENARLFFSLLWVVSTCTSFALGLLLLFTWNENYLQYFYAALIIWGAATIGTVVTSA
jgi:hypothetical protein